jgi:large subunit ribosomal protein L23
VISDPFQVIKHPVVTEKSTVAQDNANTYAFVVDRRANKVEIRTAIEKIFGVKVLQVRTMLRKGKPRRVRHRVFNQPPKKIAMVRLAKDQSIEALAG